MARKNVPVRKTDEVVPATYTLDEERGSSGMLINRGLIIYMQS